MLYPHLRIKSQFDTETSSRGVGYFRRLLNLKISATIRIGVPESTSGSDKYLGD
jgi:hypothetical protein